MARQAVRVAEFVFFNKFKGQYDDYFLKIREKYLFCLIQLNEFSKAKKTLDIVKNKWAKVKDAQKILKDLENNLNETERKKKSENTVKSKDIIKAGFDEPKTNYDWQQG